MGNDLHTIAVANGTSALLQPDRLILGMFKGTPVPASPGPLTGVGITDSGAGFTAIPTAVVGGVGVSGSITVSMGIDSAAITAAGATYAPGDSITLTGGTESTNAKLSVNTTTLVTAPAVVSGGSGYAVGDFVTLLNGVTVKVATLTGSAIATIATIGTAGCSGGSFTANITSAGGLTQVSSTGAGTGATFTSSSATYGVGSISINNPGVYTGLPTNPISQGSTSGSGSGATFTALWKIIALAVNAAGTAYLPGTPITFTGGTPTRAATGTATSAPIGAPISINFATLGAFPLTGYQVFVQGDNECNVSIGNKSATGFTVTLTPLSTTTALLTSVFDTLILA